jgi:tetratricopeptide (TPR) repeat protein
MSGGPSPRLLEALELHKAGKLAAAESVYAAILADTPDDPDALNLGGLALHALGKREEAAARFARAIALIPEFADAHANLGAVRRTEDRLDEAAACFARAIEIEPAHGFAANNLGLVRLAQGALLEAIGLFAQARALMPGQPEIVINLSIAYMKLGDPKTALKELDVLAEAAPKDKRAHFGRGAALAELGRIDEARAAFDRALALDPDYADARARREALGRG